MKREKLGEMRKQKKKQKEIYEADKKKTGSEETEEKINWLKIADDQK